ncbi:MULTISPECIES: hypothetical protein [Vibrio]|uniref:hypothetical protein n=1 Tax=Vibrio TaxID=662 RepID=UPI0003132EEA|nr:MULTISPECIES: hypothetical protein [Vibrio]MBF4426127.1 hypothetical protein [Vibrio anguillarum]MDK2604781.1 hypothetical protein [Vibrio vulnificus]MDK2626901.1 hypothetical protein [Vibrio vulnificus]MDK2721587.1 hypothetical protein [Vibrio vulnificus]MDK2725851.1 hypothetical protein [Vibrio vulnificus]
MSVFPEMRQPEGSLYCGPYCIVACLKGLNKLPLALPFELRKYNAKEVAFTGSSTDISDSDELKDLALELYKVTGIITPGENPDYIEHSGYNSLGAMLYVLRQFGLECEVLIRDTQTNEYLRRVFPIEFELIEKLGVSTKTLSLGESTPDKTMLISVISVNDSLHYILNDAQGNWFDSDIAGTSANWDFIENWHTTTNKREGADWLGVSIRVKY